MSLPFGAWTKVVFDQHTREEHEESLAELHRLADPALFNEDEICVIADPAEALAWIGRREIAMEAWRAENDECDDDPARSIRLTGDEMDWLSGFLASRQAPDTAMPFETLDGFLTALVIGPEMVMPSTYLPEIWGTEDGSGPVWDSMEQLQYFMDLLAKHWNAIAARRSADAPHRPQIDHFGDGPQGKGWAQGFVAGMNLCADAWNPLIENKDEGDVALQVLALAMESDTMLPDETRATIVEELPNIVRRIASYWRNRPMLPPANRHCGHRRSAGTNPVPADRARNTRNAVEPAARQPSTNRRVFVWAGADRFCGARYPDGVRVHHPGISPEITGEKPWILFKT